MGDQTARQYSFHSNIQPKRPSFYGGSRQREVSIAWTVVYEVPWTVQAEQRKNIAYTQQPGCLEALQKKSPYQIREISLRLRTFTYHDKERLNCHQAIWHI